MPEIITKDHKFSDAVSYYLANHNRVSQYYKLLLDNNLENWRMYWAKNPELGFGQWPLDAVARMAQQGRALIQYNIIKPAIQSILSKIIKYNFDPQFLMVNGETDSLVEAIKVALYSDKERCNWNVSEYEMTIHGLILFACLRIHVTTEYDDLGNIALTPELPGSVLPDPYWKTKISKDCKKCWKESWLTLEQLKELAPDFALRFKFEAEKNKNTGDTYGSNTGITPYGGSSNTWGSLYRVIEEYDMVTVKKEKEFAYSEQMGEVEIPSELSDELQPDDPKTKPGWLNQNVPDWHPELVFTKPSSEKVCQVHTICPTLINDEPIVEGPILEQIGCLPYKWWAADQENGEFSGVVDLQKDMQIDLNYTASMERHRMQGGDSKYVDESVFKDQNEADLFMRYGRHPGKNFRVKPNSLRNGAVPATPVGENIYQNHLGQHISSNLNEIWPRVSLQTPSSIGQPEPNNPTSGKLFELMKNQSSDLIYPIIYGRRLFYNDLHEAVFMLAVQLYSNEGVQRDFSFGDQNVTLNERVNINGMEAIRNDVSTLKGVRIKVIISDKAESPTERIDNVGVLTEYYKGLGPNNMLSATIVNAEIAKNVDQFSPESKERIVKASELEYKLAESTILVQIATNEATLAQLQAQQQAAQNPAPPPALPNGGALPGQTGEPMPETIPTAPQGPNNNPMPPAPQEPPAQGVTV